MSDKYLNYTALQYFYNRLTTVFQAKESGKGLSTNDYTTTEKNKLAGIAAGAEVNQNAFSHVKVGSTTIDAGAKTDTFELAAGNNIDFTPNATNKLITIAATDTVTTATTTGSGNAVTSVTASNGALTVTKGITFLTSSDTAAKATELATARSLDGVSFDGSSNISHFAVYTNSSNVISVTCTGFTYVDGARIHIYQAAAHGTVGGWANITLEVNGLGPKDVYYADSRNIPYIPAGMVMEYVYVNNKFYICGLDTDTIYATMTQDEASAGSASYGRLISAQVLSTTIANAVAGITGISFEVVQTLPPTGTNGIIYLVAHTHGTQDIYDEYVWLGSSYEKIGSTDIDLSDYMLKTDMVAITTSEIDSLFTSQ